jgi:hypothetical protein
MEDSHREFMQHIASLKEQITEKKRAKSQRLLRELQHDFPALAAIVRDEAERRGL